MAAVMHKNLLDTLTSGSMTMTEVAQSPDDGSIIQLTPLHESASDPTTNTIEDLKSEEKAAHVVPQTPKKGSKKRVSVSEGAVTPKKTKISPSKAKSSEDNKYEASDEDVESSPKTKKPRTPKTPKTDNGNNEKKSATRKRAPVKAAEGIAPARTIPLSWEDASEADRKLVQMKEAGKPWPEIREMWKAETGQETAGSTLPNRYSRIKVNLEHLEPGHEVLLFNALARYENEKWKTIATFMEAEGAKKYAAAFLQKEAKKMEERQASGTYLPPTTSTTTMANGIATDKVGADVNHDIVHQNGKAGEAKITKQSEKGTINGIAVKLEEDGRDQHMDQK